MEYKQIQELIKAINKSNISKLRIKEGEFEITIEQHGNGVEYMQMPQMMSMPTAMPQMQMQQSAPMQQAPSTSAPAADAAPASSGSTVTVKSPMIGTFYRSASPDKPSFVNVGDEIKQGQVLCIIEAMKLFNEIESEISGRIVKVLIDDASPVEYDQPLFVVEPA